MSDSKTGSHTYAYPRPSVTVDIALVTTEIIPRVLLIRRLNSPYAGHWALPGGFVDENERLIDAARRELKEETGLEQGDLEQLHTFGDPHRDPRGWTVSVVYMARVWPQLLTPKAGDDAAEVSWFRLDNLPPLAFDHLDVLNRVKTRLHDRQG
ncbi:NUDIX domain-containing protein [Zavarzinella formosa]|uniref:NUDIX domain-containing protein n=1 Tax=Zavarzinella formosa TaxID=360055 RepID=UPI0002F8D978|nr:NUDIX hydrolase [Zavarzinella formosa]